MHSGYLQLPSSAFPFYFRLDAQLKILSFGQALPRAIAHLRKGEAWQEYLQQIRPNTPLQEFGADNEETQMRTLFVFRIKHNGLLLRGQMISEPNNTLLFLGSPWLNDPAQLNQFGLSLNDYAVHDASTDLLQVIQDLKNSLQESRELAMQFQKQRALLQNILKTAPDAIITSNVQGLIESFNPAAQAMFGWEEKEIIGKNVAILTGQQYTEQHQEYINAAQQHTYSLNFNRRREVQARRRDQSEFPAELSLSSLNVSEEVHYTAIVRDISERKAQQMALAAARERELRLGHDIQQSLLFGKPLTLAGLEISAFTQPSQGIDGDFFDFFTLGEQSLDVFTGDVMGKGVVAAMIGAALKSQYNRTMAELLSQNHGEPPQTETVINKVHTRVTPELQRLESFVTLILARIELANNRIFYINAGHPEGLIFTASNQIIALTGEFLPIGVDRKETYSSSCAPFYPGDLLLLFSDGVTEARNAQNELLGIDAVVALVTTLKIAQIPPAIILQRLRQIVDLHESSHRRSDDFTAIGIYRHDENGPHSCEFRRQMQVLTPLRHWLKTHIRLDEMQSAALELAAVEVASNIIRHVPITLADTTFVVRIRTQGEMIEVQFYYVGDAFDPTQVPMPDFSGKREGGFGLYIIRQCVDEVEYSNPVEQVNLICLRIRQQSAAIAAIQ